MSPPGKISRFVVAWMSATFLPWMGYFALAALDLERFIVRECPVIEWERRLLGGRSAPELLVPLMELDLVNLFLVATYASFYVFLLGLPAWLLLRHATAVFRRLRITWAVAAVVGYSLYFLTPTQSPYYVLDLYNHPPFTLSQSLALGAYEMGVAFRYDAFPCMHLALALLGILATRSWLSRTGKILAWLWFGCLALATMATGAHYLLDLAAGLLLAAIVWAGKPQSSRSQDPGSD